MTVTAKHEVPRGWRRAYPGSVARRRATAVNDVLLLALLALFAWLGWRLYLRIDGITALALGVQDAGNAVQDGFNDVADAVGDVPLVGDSLADAIAGAGGLTGGNVAELGVQGEHAIHTTALLAGWLVFLLPSLVLMLSYLPRRVGQIRSANLAETVLRTDGDPERERLLATRALCALPLRQLVRFTDDPVGDLVAGRHDRLLAALRDDSGLDPVPGGAR